MISNGLKFKIMKNKRKLIVHLLGFVSAGFISVLLLNFDITEVIKTTFALCVGYTYCYIANK